METLNNNNSWARRRVVLQLGKLHKGDNISDLEGSRKHTQDQAGRQTMGGPGTAVKNLGCLHEV